MINTEANPKQAERNNCSPSTAAALFPATPEPNQRHLANLAAGGASNKIPSGLKAALALLCLVLSIAGLLLLAKQRGCELAKATFGAQNSGPNSDGTGTSSGAGGTNDQQQQESADRRRAD